MALGYTTIANQHKWNEIAPPKVNHFVWRAIEGKILMHSALVNRGMKLQSKACALFGSAEETSDHILVRCSVLDIISH
ncbi:putative reverse transcriptase zinc-binding domain-containing protein [Helianthus annuus]|nr:putative reverse transcriptase zinc-binding domain-containing protein [Helianthus annuus]KAJ0948095.1 putative reverse transcriptase zinc-binding domain-containing protein [Helianthus annuus]